MRRTYQYGVSESQAGELLLPDADDGPWPVVCLLHGGFWRAPHGREQWDAVAADLAARGYAAWNIGYRRIGEPGGGWPGTLEDVAAAIDHLAVIALDEPRLDLGRVVVAGHSAGGQLALCAGAQARSDRRFACGKVVPIALCALAGVTDLHQGFSLDSGRGAVAALLGGSPQEYPDRYAQASPLSLLPLGTRQMIIHGSEDTALPSGMSSAYAQAARAAGDAVDYFELAGTGHMEYLDTTSQAYARFLRGLGEILGGGSREA
jgi:acetyl esterase/lipase